MYPVPFHTTGVVDALHTSQGSPGTATRGEGGGREVGSAAHSCLSEYRQGPVANSIAARYETTSQLPPTMQQQQQQQQQAQWFASNTGNANSMGGNSSGIHYAAHTGSSVPNITDSLPPSSATSSAARRTPTTVLMPATFLASGPLASAAGGGTAASASTRAGIDTATGLDSSIRSNHNNDNYDDPTMDRCDRRSAQGQDAWFPAAPLTSNGAGQPTLLPNSSTNNNPHPASTRSTDQAGLAPSLVSTVHTTTTTTTAAGVIPATAAVFWASPSCSPLPATHIHNSAMASATATNARTAPLPLSEELILSPITAGLLANSGSGGGSSSSNHAGGLLVSRTTSPGTPLAGGVSTMSVGVVPAASTWGDLSMGGAGSGGVLLTRSTPATTSTLQPATAPTAAVAATPGMQTSTVGASSSNGNGNGNGNDVHHVPVTAATVSSEAPSSSRSRRTSGCDKGTPPSRQQSSSAMELPAPTCLSVRHPPATQDVDDGKHDSRSGSSSRSAGPRSAELPRKMEGPRTGADPSCRLVLHGGSGVAEPATSKPSNTHGESQQQPALAHLASSSGASSSSRQLGGSTPTSLPPSTHLVFFPMDISATGHVTPPSQQPTPLPQQAAAPAFPHVFWDPAVSWPPLPSTVATTTTSHGGSSAPLSSSPAAAALWALQGQQQQQQANPDQGQQQQQQQQQQHIPQRTPTSPLVHHPVNPPQQLYLPRVVGPTQTRVPCAPVRTGAHAECTICLQTTDDAADAEGEDAQERRLQQQQQQQQQQQEQVEEVHVRNASTSSRSSGGVRSGSPMVRLLSCGHCYHSNCLQRWLLQDGSCPLCRRSVADVPTAAATGLAAADVAAAAAAAAAMGTSATVSGSGGNHNANSTPSRTSAPVCPPSPFTWVGLAPTSPLARQQ